MGAAALTPPARRAAQALTLAGLLALVVLRLLLVHHRLDETLYWEEPYRLTIATEILSGPRLPLVEYQADHYQGGSLAVGLLAVPLVAALGPSFETLKLVPLAFALATAALWCALLWRAVGPAAAALNAWLMALAPPFAQIYQVHAMGSHAESAFFTAAGFLLLHDLAAGRGSARARAFALGAIGGLGLWFCYTAASGIAAWGLVFLWLAWRARGLDRLLPLALGGVAGLLPWLAYNASNGFRGLDRLSELLDPSRPVVTGSSEPLPTRLAALFAVDLPRALGFPEAVTGVPEATAWAYLGLVAASLVAVGWAALSGLRRVDARADAQGTLVSALIALAVAFHLLVYAVSSFRPDVETGFIAYRFFAPLYPLATAAVSLAVTRVWSGKLRPVALVAVVALLSLGGYGVVTLLRETPARPPVPTSHGYRLLGLLSAIKHRDRVAHSAALLERLEGEPRALAFFGYGWALQFEYEKYGDWSEFVRGLALCRTPEDRQAAMDGAQWALGARLSSMRREANAGYRAEWNRAALVKMSEFAARVRALPAGERGPRAARLRADPRQSP